MIDITPKPLVGSSSISKADCSIWSVILSARAPKWMKSKYSLFAFKVTNSGGSGQSVFNSGHNSRVGTGLLSWTFFYSPAMDLRDLAVNLLFFSWLKSAINFVTNPSSSKTDWVSTLIAIFWIAACKAGYFYTLVAPSCSSAFVTENCINGISSSVASYFFYSSLPISISLNSLFLRIFSGLKITLKLSVNMSSTCICCIVKSICVKIYSASVWP